MKNTTLLLSLVATLSCGLAFKASAEGEKKKEDSPIGKIMKAHFKGDTSDIKKAVKGELSKEEITKLAADLKAMIAEKPPIGEAASWKEKSEALFSAVEKLEKGEADAGAGVKAAANCKACHEAHKPK